VTREWACGGLGQKVAKGETLGKLIAVYHVIPLWLAEITGKGETLRSMMVRAARMKDRGKLNDVEVKWRSSASEYWNELLIPNSWQLRLPRGVRDRRLHREAAFMLISEGTANRPDMIIGGSLLKRTSSRTDRCATLYMAAFNIIWLVKVGCGRSSDRAVRAGGIVHFARCRHQGGLDSEQAKDRPLLDQSATVEVCGGVATRRNDCKNMLDRVIQHT
jgi:hypothetical protein